MKTISGQRATLWICALLFGASLNAAAQQKDGRKGFEPAPPIEITGSPNSQPLTAGAPNDFHIGVNDVVDIHVWKEPELSRVVAVRPDGKISLPLIGEVQAGGRTALELRQLIAGQLKAFIADPEVSVIVQQINSQRYFVMGKVAHPGLFPLSVPTTVIQALAAAGGFAEWAQTDKIMVIRHNEGNQTQPTQRIRFNYKSWLKKNRQDNSPELNNNDVIVVP